MIPFLLMALIAPVPKVAREGQILVMQADGKATLCTPGGQIVKSTSLSTEGRTIMSAKLAPNGESFVAILTKRPLEVGKANSDVVQVNWDGKASTLLSQSYVSRLTWLPDGSTVVWSGMDLVKGQDPKFARSECMISGVYDFSKKLDQTLDIDGTYSIIDVTADGRCDVALRRFGLKPVAGKPGVQSPRLETVFMDRTTRKVTVVIAEEHDAVPFGRPDANGVWFVQAGTPPGPCRFDTKTRTMIPLSDGIFRSGTPRELVVSPTGDRLAVRSMDDEVFVADTDGGHAKVIISKGNSKVVAIDWR